MPVSATLDRIKKLVSNSEYLISEHGYEELAADRLLVREVAAGLNEATEIESYPDYPKGPCVLVLQKDKANRPIHVVWGIQKAIMAPQCS